LYYRFHLFIQTNLIVEFIYAYHVIGHPKKLEFCKLPVKTINHSLLTKYPPTKIQKGIYNLENDGA